MSISGIGEKYYQNNVTTMKSTNSKDKVQTYHNPRSHTDGIDFGGTHRAPRYSGYH